MSLAITDTLITAFMILLHVAVDDLTCRYESYTCKALHEDIEQYIIIYYFGMYATQTHKLMHAHTLVCT